MSDSTPPLAWLGDFLEKLQCPVTGEALRHASDTEKLRAGIAASETALANASGTHVYPVIDGMPHLLPEHARHV
jgi:uncharacterized protein YbaR (Trm112 family)